MASDPLHILEHTLGIVLKRMPVDELARDRTAFVFWIRPCLAIELRGAQIVRQEVADDLVGEQLHPAIAMMDDEPFIRSEQLVRDHERADRVIGRASSRITDHVSIALGKSSILCRVKPRVHAGQDRKASRRRQCQLFLVTEFGSVFAVGRNDFL
ncbi:hypothetical protein chiPu_0029473 [Chiloscyllium punctatum]|uniref:Uncharacterized protein n=1 Tax=Chiloscyllium punctatum TaxID=137246 RepID=A0A401TR61_CHIPU|nr:hypothetical protein [Chiloscyllium punctatum]